MTLRTPGVRWVLLLALVGELCVWARLEGYNRGDTTEYLQIAQHWVERGLSPQPGCRPVLFPALLTPILLLGDALGWTDPRAGMLWARGLQVVLSLLFVFASMRLGSVLAHAH